MGKYRPGESGNPHGKPKGVLNKKSRQWLELHEYILNEGAERFIKYLEGCSDEKFARHYISILEYFAPKMQRTFNEYSEPMQPLNIEIIGVEQKQNIN
ncbi:hypothetical protein ACFLU5_11395 [Bacteroidota bacterium]